MAGNTLIDIVAASVNTSIWRTPLTLGKLLMEHESIE
jgi:hypothetical protein